MPRQPSCERRGRGIPSRGSPPSARRWRAPARAGAPVGRRHSAATVSHTNRSSDASGTSAIRRVAPRAAVGDRAGRRRSRRPRHPASRCAASRLDLPAPFGSDERDDLAGARASSSRRSTATSVPACRTVRPCTRRTGSPAPRFAAGRRTPPGVERGRRRRAPRRRSSRRRRSATPANSARRGARRRSTQTPASCASASSRATIRAPERRVEVGERLVDQQQDRVLDDGRRDRDERRLAGREAAQPRGRAAARCRRARRPRRRGPRRSSGDTPRSSSARPISSRDPLGRESLARMLQHDADALRRVARGYGTRSCPTTRTVPVDALRRRGGSAAR